MTGLLKESPYNGEYLAAMADTYAQAGDDHGLEQFYRDKIASFRNCSSARRRAQGADRNPAPRPDPGAHANEELLRRGGSVHRTHQQLPRRRRACHRSGPVRAALPAATATCRLLREDGGPVSAGLSLVHGAGAHADESWRIIPRRSIPMRKSIAIRPDRTDLYIARAELEERLMRFDEAAADYEHIYQLAYKDPQWMEKVAAVRARQGRVKEVVAALQAALIDGRPENAGNYFEVARRLEAWGMLEQARMVRRARRS